MKKGLMIIILVVTIFIALTVYADSISCDFSVSEYLGNQFLNYSLYHYERLGNDLSASAILYQVLGDLISFKHIEIDKDGLIKTEIDTLPLPLSEEGLYIFKTPNQIIGTNKSDGSTLLQTTDWLDLKRLSISEHVLQLDIQQDVLIVLVEDANGTRRLKLISSPVDGVYQVQAVTNSLPGDVSLDLFHSQDGEIYFMWNDQRFEVGYAKCAAADWRWDWSRFPSENGSFSYSALFCGVSMYGPWTEGNREHLLVGSMKEFSLKDADLFELPRTEAALKETLNREGWAVVNNVSSEKRTPLFTAPNSHAKSLGDFFNGTPLQVLAQEGAWTKVAIGLDGLNGWMLTSSLVFGVEMDQVEADFVQKIYLEKLDIKQPAYSSIELDEEQELSGYVHIVGIANDSLYILLTSNGHTGYVPSEWMWDGNG